MTDTSFNYSYITPVKGDNEDDIYIVKLFEEQEKGIDIKPSDLIRKRLYVYEKPEADDFGNLTYNLEENDGIATINQYGKVSGLKEGKVVGTIVSREGYTKNIAVIVKKKNVAKITEGENFTVVLKPDGTVWTWGNQSNGRLGNGVVANSNITTEARNTLYTRYKSDRRSEINTVVSANMEDYVQKVQAGFEQQNQKAQTERKEYIEKKLGGSL